MAYTQEQPDTGSAMERVTGTIRDGDRVIVRHLPILMLETGPQRGTGWRGQFDLPGDASAPRRHRFYRLETSDGRSGQIIFIGPEEVGSQEPTRVCFRTTGPFD